MCAGEGPERVLAGQHPGRGRRPAIGRDRGEQTGRYLPVRGRARITGELYLREAVIGDGSRDAAFAANGLVVDRDADCARMRCRGQVLLRGARISGSLHAAEAANNCPGGEALNVDRAVIGGRAMGPPWARSLTRASRSQ